MNWHNVILVVTLINGIICLVGVVSKNFHDNTLQRIGMAILCITSWSRSYSLMQDAVELSLLRSWVHLGIFFFAVGTCYKVSFSVWLAKHPRYWNWYNFGRRKEDLNVPQ